MSLDVDSPCIFVFEALLRAIGVILEGHYLSLF
jgi:hypothetical protein